jgi:hypothetical protein
LGLVVRKQNWRQGIGRAMMERFEIEAKKVANTNRDSILIILQIKGRFQSQDRKRKD